MLIKLNTPLHTINREVLTQPKSVVGEGGITTTTDEPVILYDVISHAVLAPNADDDTAVKVQKFELSLKIANNKQELEISAEDVVLVKSAVGKMYGPLVVGQVHRLVEGRDSGLEKIEAKEET